MIEVEMVDDIRKKDPPIIGPFTARQVICVAIAGTYSVPIAVNLPLDITYKIIIGLLIALPVAICGWIKINNEPFEIVMVRYIYKHILTKRKRRVKQPNPYYEALKTVRKKDEQARIKKMSPRKRKAYLKKKKKKKITYSRKKAYRIYR